MSAQHTSRESNEDHRGRVVVGVHGSSSSVRALRHAADIACERGWNLEVVTAWPDADDTLIHDVPGRYIAARGRAVESQHRALATLDPVIAVSADTFLVNARPAEALIARCDGADLLVVGAGRPDAERAGRPGVGAQCLASAPCPVTVVPDRPTDIEAAAPGTERPLQRPRPRGAARTTSGASV